MSIILKALHAKMRFSSSKGLLSIEEVMSLSKTNLIIVIKEHALPANQLTGLEFLDNYSSDTELEFKFKVLKEIYNYRTELETNATLEKDKREFNEMIAKKIADKEVSAYDNMSVEDLKKLLR